MNIRALKAKLATVLGQARGITDKAAAEGRDTLSAEEQSAFDGHMAASQQLRAQITNLEALADAEAGMGTALDLGQQAQVTGTKTNVADDPKRGFKSFGEYAKAVRAGAGGRHFSAGGCTNIAGDVAVGTAIAAAHVPYVAGEVPCYTDEGVPYYTPPGAPC